MKRAELDNACMYSILRQTVLVPLTALVMACSPAVEPGPGAEKPTLQDNVLIFPANSPQTSALKTERVAVRTTDEIPVFGRVILNERLTARVYSPFTGRIEALMVDWGQQVKQGDALARMTSPDVGSLRADLGKSQAELKQNRRALERTESLFLQGLVAAKELEQARAEFEKSQADYNRNLSRASGYAATAEQGQSAHLIAPVSGTVIDIHANVGTEIRAENNQSGSPALFIIGDTRRLIGVLDVPESEANRVRAGQAVSVWGLNEEGKPAHSQIAVVQSVIDPDTRMIKVRLDINNEDGRFKAEQFIKASITVPASEGVVVPASAVILSEKGSVAWVQTAPGRYERRSVTTRDLGLQKTRVLTGLQPDDAVVVEGALFLEQAQSGMRRP